MDVTIETLFESYKTVNTLIEQEVIRRTEINSKPRHQSSSIDKIAEALSAAQGKYKPVEFNRKTEMWSNEYSDFDTLMKHVLPILSEQQLMFTQRTEHDGDILYLRSILMHSSGQWISSVIRINPPKNDIECLDSIIMDQKRDQAKLLLGISLENDPRDDDGEYAMRNVQEDIKKGTKASLNRKQESYESISKEQAEELEYELQGYEDIAEEVLEKFKLRQLADMPKSVYRTAITNVRKIKRYRQEGK
jgi:hypothetical protein